MPLISVSYNSPKPKRTPSPRSKLPSRYLRGGALPVLLQLIWVSSGIRWLTSELPNKPYFTNLATLDVPPGGVISIIRLCTWEQQSEPTELESIFNSRWKSDEKCVNYNNLPGTLTLPVVPE
ncbi:unnamed protein product [Tuber melanosporum]|uniref:(Perigord truffle) hypothetical protein n=1 Tax=Tuber melanosporum (strain Mel28) TaxID=656061 RepID=D5GAG5_TUBMM|nr:uncharacterized protein GSTUM_00003632001 [Tuber melanosporum]CAZ81508.1 unnamed protein product [Tuber melanosporum]